MKPLRLTLAQTVCRNLPPLFSQSVRTLIYPQNRAYDDDYEFVVSAQTGSALKNRTSDYHGYRFSVHGYFEWRNCALAMALCGPGDTIVEIGANIGTETVCFSDIVGPSGKVYAFEPLPSNLKMLQASLSLTLNQNTTLLPLAVGDACRKVRFVVPPRQNSSGVGHILVNDKELSSKSIDVDCVTLDSESDRIGVAKLIVMDVEGAELMVLRGARNYINSNRPHLVLEASPKLLAKAGSNLSELYSELIAAEYAVFQILRLGLNNAEPSATTQACNWLCIHTSQLDAVEVAARYLRRCGLLPCIQGFNPLTKTPA